MGIMKKKFKKHNIWLSAGLGFRAQRDLGHFTGSLTFIFLQWGVWHAVEVPKWWLTGQERKAVVSMQLLYSYACVLYGGGLSVCRYQVSCFVSGCPARVTFDLLLRGLSLFLKIRQPSVGVNLSLPGKGQA